MLIPKKIVFVVDVRAWAFDFIAKSIRIKLLPYLDSCEIIYWEDYSSPKSFLRKINSLEPQLVHFFFREHLSLIINSFSPSDPEIKKFCECSCTTHIPDYLYSSENEIVSRLNLFKFIDGYFATCQDLFEIYHGCPYINDPDDIIFDWPEIEDLEIFPEKSESDPIKIMWTGNSKWGEYAGFFDYKGLDKIVLPAISILKEKFPEVIFLSFDSAKRKIDHADILKELEDVDILVIASEKEGTPLTLIEAMSRGCAVVTTDVGIAREALPEQQLHLIYERNPISLSNSLAHLCENIGELKKYKKANFERYKILFGNDGPLLSKWLAFLNRSYERGNLREENDKINLLTSQYGGGQKIMSVTILRSLARVARKLKLIDKINNVSPWFSKKYNEIIHGGNSYVGVDEKLINIYYENLFKNRKSSHPIVIYSPMWKGVAASTEALFPNDSIRFPYSDSEYPEVETHVHLEKLSEFLVNNKAVPIIYSGGSKIHLQLAKRVRQIDVNVKQFFLWHGSPAQWVDDGQNSHFQKWQAAYRNNVINGMIVLKPGLDHALENIGIQAWGISNPIPFVSIQDRTENDDGLVRVGIFSAIKSWYKNPYPQLISIAGNENFILSTNIEPSDIAHIDLNIKSINHYPHMPRRDFLGIMSQQDLILYITNTECSPMTALESWAMNIPCIVGPAGDVYSEVSRELASFLVEPEVDNPNAIANRISIVLSNREKIIYLLKKHRDDYNLECRKKHLKLISDLSEFNSLIH